MMSFGEIEDRLIRASNTISELEAITGEGVQLYDKELLSLNRDQMLLGRDSDGNVLSPSYLSDPYFKTPEAAQAYAAMKYNLEQQHRNMIHNPILFPEKGRETPNLIVRGDFQAGLFITTTATTYEISSTYIDGPDINDKYNGKAYGIAPESADYFFYTYIVPTFLKIFFRDF